MSLLALSSGTNTGLILLGATTGVGAAGYFIRQLLRHAEILSVVTTEIKQIPINTEDIRTIGGTVTDIRLEQVRVATELDQFRKR